MSYSSKVVNFLPLITFYHLLMLGSHVLTEISIQSAKLDHNKVKALINIKNALNYLNYTLINYNSIIL